MDWFSFLILTFIGIGVGIIASLVGISGGAFKTPILIIVFGVIAEVAAASSLISALFVAIASTVGYYRQDPQLIGFKIGTLFIITTIPGAYFGVLLRTFIQNRETLRFIFGVVLFPVALKLLLAMPKTQTSDVTEEEKRAPSFNELDRKKVVLAVLLAFFAGMLAGFIGLGGGTIIVPVLCMLLQFPMIAAAATSMFTMMFTASAGTIINYTVLRQTEFLFVFIFYGVALGIGTLIGGSIGSRSAYTVDTAQLQRLFGFLLIFPLVTMMKLGHLWLDPGGSDYIAATIGNVVIWLVIGIPLWILATYYLLPRKGLAPKNVKEFPTDLIFEN